MHYIQYNKRHFFINYFCFAENLKATHCRKSLEKVYGLLAGIIICNSGHRRGVVDNLTAAAVMNPVKNKEGLCLVTVSQPTPKKNLFLLSTNVFTILPVFVLSPIFIGGWTQNFCNIWTGPDCLTPRGVWFIRSVFENEANTSWWQLKVLLFYPNSWAM